MEMTLITCILTASLHPGITSLRFTKYNAGISGSVFSSFFFSTAGSPDKMNTILVVQRQYYLLSDAILYRRTPERCDFISSPS